MSEELSPEVSPLYDIKEIGKRTYQLGIIALVLGVLISFFCTILQLYPSALLVISFCSMLGIILLLHYKNILKNIKFALVVTACFFLDLSAWVESGASGQYLYFFPLMVIIPIIVDNTKTYKREVFAYFSMATISCLACIMIGRHVTPLEYLNAENKHNLFYTNAVTAIALTIAFSFANVFLERRYVAELLNQKNRTIATRTRFLSVMGHELRTPLNGIIGAINILINEKNLPEQQEYLDILKYCADHLLHQVNDVLDFNKIEADKLEIHPVPVNLRALLLKSAIPFYNIVEGKNLELLVDVDPKLDEFVMADDVRLIQILNNLFSNALKFTEHGHIKLQASLTNKADKQIVVKFRVEDTGPGIKEADLQHIFENFWQVYDAHSRGYNGTGLGLAISKHLLNLMGADLLVSSTVNQGTCFYFTIGFGITDTPPEEFKYTKSQNRHLAGLKTLIVEDNQINMIIARKVLTDMQAKVTTAYNGLEALERLAQNPTFDIILLDLEMPVMNGYQAIQKIKEKYPNIPVIAFTATLVDNEKLSNLKEMGFADCVLKPFQPQHLSEVIKQHLPYVNTLPRSVKSKSTAENAS